MNIIINGYYEHKCVFHALAPFSGTTDSTGHQKWGSQLEWQVQQAIYKTIADTAAAAAASAAKIPHSRVQWQSNTWTKESSRGWPLRMADLFETNPKDIRIFVQVETTISVGALPCFTTMLTVMIEMHWNLISATRWLLKTTNCVAGVGLDGLSHA